MLWYKNGKYVAADKVHVRKQFANLIPFHESASILAFPIDHYI